MAEKNPPTPLEVLSAKLDKALTSSPLLSAIKLLAQTDQSLRSSGRLLSDLERDQLMRQGNYSADWNCVRVENDTSLETIRNNHFSGNVLIKGFHGNWKSPDGRSWPAGMSGCRISNSIIGNACLYQIAQMDRQVIHDGAVVVGVGEMECPSPTQFSLGRVIHPGTETGGRSVWLWDEITLDDCMIAVTLSKESQKIYQEKMTKALAPYLANFGFVGKGAAILHTRRIQGAYIGAGTLVNGASLLRETSVLSNSETYAVAMDNAWIENSLIQPGARVESSGKVSESLLLSGSSVAWGGMVAHSVIGSHTQIHKGEVTASIVGPFVGFHHQSLLISALWPEGRGNIAYGANVGSNHTGRKPDQEIRPGEGNFFGLGCTIKFPANYNDAPYSLFATGVSTLPQRVAFPFSLIIQPINANPDLGSALNEIIPGWMWSDNAFSLVRRSYKLHKAMGVGIDMDKGFFSGVIFTITLARKVVEARRYLRMAPTGLGHYSEKEIPGLGKNFLRPEVLKKAINTYADYLTFFLMRTYCEGPQSDWSPELAAFIDTVRQELDVKSEPADFLAEHQNRLGTLRQTILGSLLRDDHRGKEVFSDYENSHSPPDQDPAIVRLGVEVAQLQNKLESILHSASR